MIDCFSSVDESGFIKDEKNGLSIRLYQMMGFISLLRKQPIDPISLLWYLTFKQVRELENHPLFNAGQGSVLTTEGTVEMEACIMDGKTKKCGAVSGLKTVVNAISLARLVMDKTPHIYLAFEGAEAFAREQVSTFPLHFCKFSSC